MGELIASDLIPPYPPDMSLRAFDFLGTCCVVEVDDEVVAG